jgi:hypothetical protein
VFYTTANGASNPTEQLRITSDRYVRLASGTGGIQFNGDTAVANALDDYEEGTWTPTVRGSTTAGTYTLSSTIAYYTKIGNQVTVWGSFGFSAATGGTGNVRCEGLPFNYKADIVLVGSLRISNADTTSSSSHGMTMANTASGLSDKFYPVITIDNAGTEQIPISGISTSSYFVFTFTYTVS